MINLLEEMLFCEWMLNCETTGCYATFEPEEPPHDPMEPWSQRAAEKAVEAGWSIGRTGLVKCPACIAAGK
jgi:hypothetical protein